MAVEPYSRLDAHQSRDLPDPKGRLAPLDRQAQRVRQVLQGPKVQPVLKGRLAQPALLVPPEQSVR